MRYIIMLADDISVHQNLYYRILCIIAFDSHIFYVSAGHIWYIDRLVGHIFTINITNDHTLYISIFNEDIFYVNIIDYYRININLSAGLTHQYFLRRDPFRPDGV